MRVIPSYITLHTRHPAGDISPSKGEPPDACDGVPMPGCPARFHGRESGGGRRGLAHRHADPGSGLNLEPSRALTDTGKWGRERPMKVRGANGCYLALSRLRCLPCDGKLCRHSDWLDAMKNANFVEFEREISYKCI